MDCRSVAGTLLSAKILVACNRLQSLAIACNRSPSLAIARRRSPSLAIASHLTELHRMAFQRGVAARKPDLTRIPDTYITVITAKARCCPEKSDRSEKLVIPAEAGIQFFVRPR